MNEKVINKKLLKEHLELTTLGGVRAFLNVTKKDIHEILKTPHELFIEMFGEEYSIQPTYSNRHHTEYIVLDNDLVLSFQINNTDYNVFDVKTSGTFFANSWVVEKWFKFLKLCAEIKILIYDLQYYE